MLLPAIFRFRFQPDATIEVRVKDQQTNLAAAEKGTLTLNRRTNTARLNLTKPTRAKYVWIPYSLRAELYSIEFTTKESARIVIHTGKEEWIFSGLKRS